MAKRKRTEEGRQEHEEAEALTRLATLNADEIAYVQEYVRLRTVYSKKRIALQQRQHALANGQEVEGMSVRLDGNSVSSLYMSTLVDIIFPPDTLERIRFEMDFDEKIEETLNNMAARAREALEAKKSSDAQKKLLLPEGRTTQGGLVLPGKGDSGA